MSALCAIDDGGRLALPAEIADTFRQNGIHHVLVVQTWDGFRLEPVGDAEAEQMRADEADPLGALRALTGGA